MTLNYRRSRFSTRLPTNRFYSRGHYWILSEASACRIGLTKFAVRMLGEIVELDFEVKQGDSVETGQVVGWMEGFKAVSDLYSPITGLFIGGNPLLSEDPAVVRRDPYEKGWLFAVEGELSEDLIDAQGYAEFLDGTIDKMMGRSG